MVLNNPATVNVAAIVDAVWDEAAAGHVAAGSIGALVERLDIIAAGGAGELNAARMVLLSHLDADISTRLGALTGIDRGTISLTSSEGSDTATVGEVVEARSILSHMGDGEDGFTGNTANRGYKRLARFDLTNATTVTAFSASGSAAGTIIVGFELVEYNA